MPSKEYEKRLLILYSLSKQNYSASKKATLDYLRVNHLLNLLPEDLQIRKTRNEEVWRNSFAYIRQHLVQEGYLSNKKIGIWEVTDVGKKYFEILAKELNLFHQKTLRYITPKSYLIITQIFRLDINEKELIECIKNDINNFEQEEERFEGEQKKRLSNYYERDPILRKLAIEYHGLNCKVCNFNFFDKYGELGKYFIEVHHITPISKLVDSKKIDYKTDLTVLCSNCHRIIHRKKDNLLSIYELSIIIKNAL